MPRLHTQLAVLSGLCMDCRVWAQIASLKAGDVTWVAQPKGQPWGAVPCYVLDTLIERKGCQDLAQVSAPAVQPAACCG